MKSVFLTGASGVGKSTTYNLLAESGYERSPGHLTRPPRDNELEGLDAYFITVEQFAENLSAGRYLEKTMVEAEYGGVYYGSPTDWEEGVLTNQLPFVAIPSNAPAFRGLLKRLAEQGRRESVLWVNLSAPLETRLERVSRYISDPIQLHNRLHNGLGQGVKVDADRNIDTSRLCPEEVLTQITSLAK